jgi:hypothetical protein
MSTTDEFEPRFYKSSFSAQGGCLEIAFTSTGDVLVRDSKAFGGDQHELRFNEREWRAFTAGVHALEFEYPER